MAKCGGGPMTRHKGRLRGVDDFECLSLGGIDEFIVDEQPSSIAISTILCKNEMGWNWRGVTVVGMIFRLEV